jgi:ParB-like chromosome segregation protein Spo0J
VIRIKPMKNDLDRVLRLVSAFKAGGTSRQEFARRHRLHPSTLSRILRVGDLPPELLSELASFERLSRTHLEVLATAPEERRRELVSAVREGRSTYTLRERRETTAVSLAPPPPAPEPVAEEGRAALLARELGSTPQETRDFALELLSVLLRSSRERVRASLEQFRARR